VPVLERPLIHGDAMMEAHRQRRQERSRLVQAAKLRSSNGGPAISCMIRDISPDGARLRVPLGFDVDGDILVTSLAIGQDRAARIVWRDASSIGIAFV
jgi:hypothetical protein